MTDGSGKPDGPAEPAPPPGPGRAAGARRRSGPLPAQQRLMAQIAASRRARQQRALLAITGALSALVLFASGGAWVVTSYVTGHVGRLGNTGTSGTPASGPLNILVAGVDIRAGLTRRQQLRLHVGDAVSTNSDTLMVVHIPADHSYVQVVSLPRDSWVNIPGHGMNKINSAFGLGGPRLMVGTVAAATGLTINDYVEVNFLGFVKIIDAVGGVNICLPFAVNDPESGLRLAAGSHHVDGITALKFARDRHSFAASDLARIDDQQQLLATMLSQAASAGTLSDPFRLQRLLSSVTAAVRVDQGFNIVSLANELRGLQPADVAFSTVPISDASYQAPTGESAVLWNANAAARMFAQMKADRRPAGLSAPARRGQAARPGGHRRRRHHPAGGPGPATPTTGPGQPRTAAQAACH